MKILLISVLVLISRQDKFDELYSDLKWMQYKLEYSLVFDEQEDQRRKEIFITNHRFIEEHNDKNSNLKLKMNKFGHLHTDEILMNNVMKKTKITKPHSIRNFGDLPVKKSVDWRTFGVVSPIKDQLECRSSYAFGAIGAIESAYGIDDGSLPILSEQEIVDCSGPFGNYGCEGGWPTNVFEFAKTNGLLNQTFYPYTGKEGECRSNAPVRDYRVVDSVLIYPGDEEQLVRALSNNGPVSVAMDVSFREFRFYSSGILNSTDCSQYMLNHAILAVGYNLTGKPHYIVKNRYKYK
ncbi:Digestive cysteine proteinase 2 [Thelohanellus kitauei]|uniref:Digestive cysteine proteinase 2 n=1 Tax=Thelohanellus kitauei TaxID=669202 RepID=A0A0C2JR73_THEKT|nr:Digestive cysteine proteinase 2 [Thelohanellus kitauei]